MKAKQKFVKSKTISKEKKEYIKPQIKEVWNEEIGLTGAFLLEM